MTILTQTLTKATEKLGALTGKSSTQQLLLDEAVKDLQGAASALGLTTVFTADGGIVGDLPGYYDGMVEKYLRLREQVETARDDREAALKALKIGGGVVIGATVAGLALREAHRRGWTNALNHARIIRVTTRKYGKLAGQAAKWVIAGKVKGVAPATDETTGDTRCLTSRLTTGGILAFSDSGDSIPVPFFAITGIRIERVTTAKGVVEQATLIVKK
jgi:hypothetical protein